MPNNVEITFTGREAQLHAAVQRVITQFATTEQAVKKTAAAGETLEQRFKSIGMSAARDLAGMAAGWLSVQAAITLATAALNAYDKAAQSAADRKMAAETGERKLLQLAAGDPVKLKELQATRDALRRAGQSHESALSSTFELESADKLDQRDLYAKVAELGVDPAVAVQAVQKLQTNFGDKIKGDLDELAAILMASKESPADFESIAREAAEAMSSFEKAGFSAADMLAVEADFSKALKNPNIAAGQAKALGRRLAELRRDSGTDLGGDAFVSEIPKLIERGQLRNPQTGKPYASLGEAFPDDDSFDGLTVYLKRQQQIRDLSKRIDEQGQKSLTGEDIFTQSVNLGRGDTSFKAMKSRRAADQSEQLSTEDAYSDIRNRTDALMNRFKTLYREQGHSELGVDVLHGIDRWSRWLFGDKAFLNSREGILGGREQLDQFIESGMAPGRLLPGSTSGDPGGSDPEMSAQTSLLMSIDRNITAFLAQTGRGMVNEGGRLPVAIGPQPLREPGADRYEGRPPPLAGRRIVYRA